MKKVEPALLNDAGFLFVLKFTFELKNANPFFNFE